MEIQPNALKWMRLSNCWKPLIQAKEGGWFLMTKPLAASVSAHHAVLNSFQLIALRVDVEIKESKLWWFLLLLRLVM